MKPEIMSDVNKHSCHSLSRFTTSFIILCTNFTLKGFYETFTNMFEIRFYQHITFRSAQIYCTVLERISWLLSGSRNEIEQKCFTSSWLLTSRIQYLAFSKLSRSVKSKHTMAARAFLEYILPIGANRSLPAVSQIAKLTVLPFLSTVIFRRANAAPIVWTKNSVHLFSQVYSLRIRFNLLLGTCPKVSRWISGLWTFQQDLSSLHTLGPTKQLSLGSW